ncbi:MAG: hypothetical protein LC734_11755 [Acidobacteria bacterium]|nr:hypothetical protein [Acidobacteriota bacterium]
MWVAAAVGIAVGLGEIGLALIATIISVIVLAVLGKVEADLEDKKSR